MSRKKKRLLLMSGVILLLICGAIGYGFLRKQEEKQILASIELTFQDDLILEYGDEVDSRALIKTISGEWKGCSALDSKRLGKQKLTCRVEKEGLYKTFEQEVVVRDTKAPEILLKKEKLVLQSGVAFQAEAYIKSIKDPVDGKLAYTKKADDKQKAEGYYMIDSNVDTKRPGDYRVIYRAVDKNGNKKEKTLAVRVEKKKETKVNEKPTTKGSSDTKTVYHASDAATIGEKLKAQLSKNGNWALYAQKFADGSSIVFNDHKARAASLIKLYIMGAVFEDYEKLCASYGASKVNALLYSMITVSDNTAANTLTKMLGEEDAVQGRNRINQYCQAHGYHSTAMGRMLLESTVNGDNYTSAADCALFLKRVYNRELPHAELMLSYLKQQQRTAKIPAGLPDNVASANKTGELADVENDAAIVLDGENSYVLVVLSENVSNTAGARAMIRSVSSQIYAYYKG